MMDNFAERMLKSGRSSTDIAEMIIRLIQDHPNAGKVAELLVVLKLKFMQESGGAPT